MGKVITYNARLYVSVCVDELGVRMGDMARDMMDWVAETHTPLIITKTGEDENPLVVLIPIDDLK